MIQCSPTHLLLPCTAVSICIGLLCHQLSLLPCPHIPRLKQLLSHSESFTRERMPTATALFIEVFLFLSVGFNSCFQFFLGRGIHFLPSSFLQDAIFQPLGGYSQRVCILYYLPCYLFPTSPAPLVE